MISYRIEDHGGYCQVYQITPEIRGPRGGLKQSGCEVKLGNIYSPGYESFGEVQHPSMWVAETGFNNRGEFTTVGAAIEFLIGEKLI